MKVFIAKLETELEIDFEALPQVSKDFIINYGIKQKLNDCVANPEFKKGEKGTKDRIDDMVLALMEGTITQRAAGVIARDPLTTMAMQIAREALRTKGVKRTKDNAEAFNQKVLELSKHPRVIAIANERLASLADIELPVI